MCAAMAGLAGRVPEVAANSRLVGKQEVGTWPNCLNAGFGPIVRNTEESRKLYGKALGISFKEETGGYLHTGDLKGAKEFALWPLSQAAQSCFGSDTWPSSIP